MRRGALGSICAAFGLLHLLPVAFLLLSSGGPVPVPISARAWSAFFFGHFTALILAGLGYVFAASAREGVFHGGPLIDFLLVATAFMLLSSAIAELAGRATPSWPALCPGGALLGLGLRLKTGRPLLGS